MVFVEPNTTVAELKVKVSEAMAVPARSQCLVYKGRDLKNAQTYEDCNIEDATSITLFNTSADVASVVSPGSAASNIGTAGYALGLLVRTTQQKSENQLISQNQITLHALRVAESLSFVDLHQIISFERP